MDKDKKTRFVKMAFTVTQEQAEWLKARKDAGFNLSAVMRMMLDNAIKSFENKEK